jgi:hypothetical protein
MNPISKRFSTVTNFDTLLPSSTVTVDFPHCNYSRAREFRAHVAKLRRAGSRGRRPQRDRQTRGWNPRVRYWSFEASGSDRGAFQEEVSDQTDRQGDCAERTLARLFCFSLRWDWGACERASARSRLSYTSVLSLASPSWYCLLLSSLT